MRIDFSVFNTYNTKEALHDYCEKIARNMDFDDPICLSDCLAGHDDGGQLLRIKIAEYDSECTFLQIPRPTWRIKVIRDEWGNPPNPGDKIGRRYKRPLTKERNGETIPYSGDELSKMIAMGTYEQKFHTYKYFTVDEKGCIECTFHDAIYFLNLWGIHFSTGMRLTSKEEHSTEPVECPDGQERHVWYWRYKECPNDIYNKLPILEASDEPKRGYESSKKDLSKLASKNS